MPTAVRDQDDSLGVYMSQIAQSTPLTRQVETDLAVRIREGDLGARDELVGANLRFVVDVAKRYLHAGVAFNDLINAGNLGLITAAERFDGTKGFKFISYAVWWIRQAIQQEIGDQSRTVRLPMNKSELVRTVSKAAKRLGVGLEHRPELAEIAAVVGVSEEEVRDALLIGRPVLSLDEFADEEEGVSLHSTLSDTKQPSPEAQFIQAAIRTRLDRILAGLDTREERVIRLYFGFDGEERRNLQEVANYLGCSREWVRQLKLRALEKLRHRSCSTELLAIASEAGVAE